MEAWLSDVLAATETGSRGYRFVVGITSERRAMLSSYVSFSPWPMALMLVALCAALETWLSGPKPFRFLASLKQPRWALPMWGWMIVGGAFYVIMTLGVAAMLQAQEQGSVAFVMIIAVMVTDGIWNYLLFRRRRFDWAYWYLFPYTVLVAATTVAVFTVDVLAGGLIAIYLAFLPYDFAWTKALGALNPHLCFESGH